MDGFRGGSLAVCVKTLIHEPDSKQKVLWPGLSISLLVSRSISFLGSFPLRFLLALAKVNVDRSQSALEAWHRGARKNRQSADVCAEGLVRHVLLPCLSMSRIVATIINIINLIHAPGGQNGFPS